MFGNDCCLFRCCKACVMRCNCSFKRVFVIKHRVVKSLGGTCKGRRICPNVFVKGKGKIYPRTGHEGTEGSSGIALLSL